MKQLSTMPSGFIGSNWKCAPKSCLRHKIKSKQNGWKMWRVRGNRNICREKVLKQRVNRPFHKRTWDNLIQVLSVHPGVVSCAVVRHVLLHLVHQVKRYQSGYVLVFCLLIRFPWEHGGVEKCYQPPEQNGMHPTCTRPVGSLFCRHRAGWTFVCLTCPVCGRC